MPSAVYRRRQIMKARTGGEREVKRAIYPLMQKQFKAIERELRKANLRKRIKKARATDMTGLLSGWATWEALFSQTLKNALDLGSLGVWTTEAEYFKATGDRSPRITRREVLDNYFDRSDTRITDISNTTEKAVNDAIAKWYNTEAGLPELIAILERWFDPARAELIATTEMAYVASAYAYNMMQDFGIKKWQWDAFQDGVTCDLCLDLMEQSKQTPFDVDDPMPPDPSHPNCRCGVYFIGVDVPINKFVKGGPGSGNFGHSGRVGIVGGSGGGNALGGGLQTNFAGKAWAYHGTSIDAALKIQKEGVKKHKATIGNRPPSVYFMQDQKATREYVGDGMLEEGQGYAIVSFNIPASNVGDVFIDEEEGDSFRIETDIPPEWIGDINWYDSDGNWTSKPPVQKTAGITGYIAVVFDIPVSKGGAGSGNFGHSGRQGLRGGSGGGGAGGGGGFGAGARRFGQVTGFAARGELNQQMHEEFEEWENGLSDEQKVAVRKYTKTWHEEINEGLRDGKPIDEIPDELARHYARNLDAAMQSAPGFKEDTIVFRGIDYDPNLKVGDTFLDKGFMSTSIEPTVADTFALYDEETPVVFEINYPAETPAAYVSDVGGNGSELEVLLPRNVELEVAGITQRPSIADENINVTVYQMNVVDVYTDEDLKE
jgi:hypothetical protein